MSGDGLQSIGRDFLHDIDAYFAQRWSHTSCAQIYEAYMSFFRDLKEVRGNSSGFTGLSEYLMFRFLYHMMGGSFTRREVTRDLSEFVSNKVPSVKIAQSPGLRLEKRHSPDIVIYENNTPLGVIEIKIVVTSSVEDVRRGLGDTGALRKAYSKMRALFISFYKIEQGGTLHSLLQDYKSGNPWFDYLVLEDNQQILKDAIVKGLPLHIPFFQ